MSERDEDQQGGGGGAGGAGGSFGAFLVGVVVGAAVGFLFAPAAGTATRRRVAHKLEGLKELAAEKAGQLGELVAAAREDRAAVSAARQELGRRVLDARRRRHAARAARSSDATVAPGDENDGGDEPVA
jgi:gas vesicle protein